MQKGKARLGTAVYHTPAAAARPEIALPAYRQEGGSAGAGEEFKSLRYLNQNGFYHFLINRISIPGYFSVRF